MADPDEALRNDSAMVAEFERKEAERAEKKSAREWENVGVVAIDSGLVALIDPASVDAVVADTGDGPIVNRRGITVGEVVESGWGDGIFDVEVRRERGRVAEMRVRFCRTRRHPGGI